MIAKPQGYDEAPAYTGESVQLPAGLYICEVLGARQERYREFQKFKAMAMAILKGYWMLLCEAANDFASPHFEEALQELSIVEYRMDCLEKCPEKYYTDRKAVRTLGEIERRIAGWNDGAYSR